MAILHLRPLIAGLLLGAALPASAHWTDPNPVAGVTPVRARHLIEIETRIESRLNSCRLPGVPVPAPGPRIRAADINNLRRSVNALYEGYRKPAPVYTDGQILTAGARIRLIYLVELRNLVDAAQFWPCPDCGACSAVAPLCGRTTTGTDECGEPCRRVGGPCDRDCVPTSCFAPVPACDITTFGIDDCGHQCSHIGLPCGSEPP